MNCASLRSRVSELLDNELSYSDSQKFHQHLDGCTSCTEIYAGLQHLKADLALQPTAGLKPDFVDRLQESVRAEQARGPSLWEQITTPKVIGLSPLSLTGLAAAAMSAMIVGSSLMRIETAPILSPPTAAKGNLAPIMPALPQSVPGQTAMPVQAVLPSDSLTQRRDTSRRDFSRQLQLVNQNRP